MPVVDEVVAGAQIEVSIDSIDLDGAPPVAGDDEDFRALRSSIRASGVRTPIVVAARADGRLVLVDGRMRLLAARACGLSAIPALVEGRVDSLVIETPPAAPAAEPAAPPPAPPAVEAAMPAAAVEATPAPPAADDASPAPAAADEASPAATGALDATPAPRAAVDATPAPPAALDATPAPPAADEASPAPPATVDATPAPPAADDATPAPPAASQASPTEAPRWVTAEPVAAAPQPADDGPDEAVDGDEPRSPRALNGYAAGARSRRWRITPVVRRGRPASTAPSTAAEKPSSVETGRPAVDPDPPSAHAAAEPSEPEAVFPASTPDATPDRIDVDSAPPAAAEPPVAEVAAAPQNGAASAGWQIRERPAATAAPLPRLARLAQTHEPETDAEEQPTPSPWLTRTARPAPGPVAAAADSPETTPAAAAPAGSAAEAESESPPVIRARSRVGGAAETRLHFGSTPGPDPDEDDTAPTLVVSRPDDEEDGGVDDVDDTAARVLDELGEDPLLPDDPDADETTGDGPRLPSASPGVTRAAGMLSVGEELPHPALRPLAQLRRVARSRHLQRLDLGAVARTGGLFLGLAAAAIIVVTLVMQGDGTAVSPAPVYGAIGGFSIALLAMAHERLKADRPGR